MASFQKVGECLYCYMPTGMYYGHFEVGGREVRRNLGTTDKCKLADIQRELLRMDLAAGKCSLAEMCDRYLATVQHQKPKTVQ